MPKRTRKLLVYLDQNFISEMAKAKVNERVKREFHDVYELLHKGFIEEKLVVPQSWMHEIETSLALTLKERIVSYQNYLGQVELYRPDEVSNNQIGASLQRFLGDNDADPLSIGMAFRHHPDKRVQQVNITVDMHLERRDFTSGRVSTAQAQETLRRELLQAQTTYDAQIENEQAAERNLFLKNALDEFGHLCEHPREELLAFVNSNDFRKIPVVSISARLYAAILTKFPARQVKTGDAADITILSTYLPYMDVVCTDAFMAEQLQRLGIAKEHEVRIFTAKTTALTNFKVFLEDYLKDSQPVRRPTISVFVLPSPSIKERAFQFFFDLGAAAREFGQEEYAEVYAFDDGHMPQYELHGIAAPFYGLQTVRTIDLTSGTTMEEILSLCRKHCRSDKFVLINEFREIQKLFLLGAVMAAEVGKDTASGYRIYATAP